MPFNTQPPYVITRVSDVTASRALEQNYTNLTGKTMFVHATVRITTGVSPNLAQGMGYVDGQPKAAVGYETDSPSGMNSYFELVFPVPPGSIYKVTSALAGSGAIFLYTWVEAY